MQELARLVRRFGFVEPARALDALGYKHRYRQILMRRVGRRIENLQRGGDPNEYRVRGVVEFLQALHARGVRLYLTSGTDRDDVVNEAKLLGYADLFDGGIYGEVDEVTRESKELLLEKLMGELGIDPARSWSSSATVPSRSACVVALAVWPSASPARKPAGA